MIDGVEIKKLRVIPDERGRLCEILRCDDPLFVKFGQVYMTTAYPEVVKAWHYHKLQTDLFGAVAGMFKVVLYDDRKNSPTEGQVQEFFTGIHNPMLIRVPKLVWHGFKCISETEAIMVNVPDLPYNYEEPDEYRKLWDDPTIPYNWNRKNG